ncbi:MAG: hypothetical protein KC457_17420 [Myxococcales bacterium]|nr:hypothetical protein [Myxococcales bacterium]
MQLRQAQRSLRRRAILVGLAGLSGLAGALGAEARTPPHDEPMPYYCPPIAYPPQQSWAAQLAPGGGYWWSNLPIDAAEASCLWRSAGGSERTATLEHYPARPDTGLIGHSGWTWVSAPEGLDPGESWGLECRWLPQDCTPPACPEGGYLVNTGMMSVVAPQALALPPLTLQAGLEYASCDGGGPFLRLRPTDPAVDFGNLTLWTEGGVLRVGYPDGSWALALPDYGDPNGGFSVVPQPNRDERWLGVELVDGSGAVVARQRIELSPDLWETISNPNQYYDGGRGGVGAPAHESGRGCKRK